MKENEILKLALIDADEDMESVDISLPADPFYLTMLSEKTRKCYKALQRFKRILGPERYQEWHERDDVEIAQKYPEATCMDCKVTKPRDDFYREDTKINRLQARCKECSKAWFRRAWRERQDRKAVKP